MVQWTSRIAALSAAAAFTMICTHVGAQTAASYPGKPVRIIVPYAPGTSTELLASIYTERLTRDWGQPFVFDHRPGGDTLVGVQTLTKAVPDGYTLLAVTSTIIINHWLYPDRQYDTLKDVAVVAPLTRQSSVMVLSNAVPTGTLKEFIAYAKANPGKINSASAASGTILHNQRFMNATGTQFTFVNYKSPGQILPDLLAGVVHIFFSGPATVAPHIRAGKLRGLAVGGDKRSAVVPDVPTFVEAGLPEFDATNWNTLFAPGRTPRDIVEKLNAAVRKAQTLPEVVGGLDKLGLVPYGQLTVSQSEELMRNELDRFGRLVKDAGLKPGN